MSKNYSDLSHDELVAEKTRLHKKLIWPNIVIAIIAIVACLIQLLMPFFKISVNLSGEVVADAVDVLYADYGDNECLLEDSDDSVISALMTKSNLKKMTANVNSTLSIPLSATELMSVAFASDDEAEDKVITLLAGILEKMKINDELESILEAMMPAVISTVVVETITSSVNEVLAQSSTATELTEEQTEVINSAATSIETYLQTLASADSVEEVKEQVKQDIIDTVETTIKQLEIEDISDEDIAEVSSIIDENFDKILEYATDDSGSFSYTELLNNLDALISDLSGTSSSDSSDDSSEDNDSTELTDEEIAAYLLLVPSEVKTAILATLTADELASMTEAEQNRYIYEYYLENYASSSSSANEIQTIRYTLTADSGTSGTTTSTSGDDTTSTITTYINLLNDGDYESLIREILGDEGFDDGTLSTIKTASMAMFIAIVVISALWGILALLAILHIFLPNKKVGMWYVKIFGGLAAIIFFLVPMLLILIKGAFAPMLASMFGVEEGLITTILGAMSFGGAGLIVLICLLALWLVSIFWCHPIKKNIKKCKKALKTA